MFVIFDVFFMQDADVSSSFEKKWQVIRRYNLKKINQATNEWIKSKIALYLIHSEIWQDWIYFFVVGILRCIDRRRKESWKAITEAPVVLCLILLLMK